jgi:hypothetical protein
MSMTESLNGRMTRGTTTLQEGGRVPHFEVTTIDGARFRYAEVWQLRNLVLISLPDDAGPAEARAAALCARIGPLFDDVACVATRDPVPGVPRPGLLIADKWGEIVTVASGEPPDAAQAIEWLNFVRHQCPECQGEAR